MPAPAVTGIAPSSGPVAGGTQVTITGTNLLNASEVDFGSTATTISNNTDTQIVVISPPGTVGSDDITVYATGGSSAKGVLINNFNK